MHAKGRLEDVVNAAITKGFTHFGFSEHMPRSRQQDLYPEEVDGEMTPEKLWAVFEEYVREGRRLQSERKGDINLLVGLETEFITSGSMEDVARLVVRRAAFFTDRMLHTLSFSMYYVFFWVELYLSKTDF
jgi:histidinol-phosphatase (PHP family)